MTDKQILAMQALSQDLYRVAIGRHRGQEAMAERFTKEAESRIAELPELPYREKILISLASHAERSAEDLLMYSTLVQNRTV